MEKIYTVLVRSRSYELQNLKNNGQLEHLHIYDRIEVEYQSMNEASALEYYNTLPNEYGEYWFFVAKYLVHSRLDFSMEDDGIINENLIKMHEAI